MPIRLGQWQGAQPSIAARYDVVGFGSLNVDYIVPGPVGDDYFDDLESGEERWEKDYTWLLGKVEQLRKAPHLDVQVGGSTTNMLRALKRIAPSLDVCFCGLAGSNAYDMPLDELERLVDTQIEWVDGGV